MNIYLYFIYKIIISKCRHYIESTRTRPIINPYLNTRVCDSVVPTLLTPVYTSHTLPPFYIQYIGTYIQILHYISICVRLILNRNRVNLFYVSNIRFQNFYD